jgi:hypothetical protein
VVSRLGIVKKLAVKKQHPADIIFFAINLTVVLSVAKVLRFGVEAQNSE